MVQELEGMTVEAHIALEIGNLRIQNIVLEQQNQKLAAETADLRAQLAERTKPLDVDEDLVAVDGHQ